VTETSLQRSVQGLPRHTKSTLQEDTTSISTHASLSDGPSAAAP
jgi:hypothetical protein